MSTAHRILARCARRSAAPALAGAPLPDLAARANQRLIGLLALPAPQLSPRAPPLQTPPPRGPPVLA
jgi:hypothetical protein